MHVALIANSTWLEDELPTLRHLTVGLIDEQVRVAQVVPMRLPDHLFSEFGRRLSWKTSRIDWLNRERIIRLDQPLEAFGVDLLHALDGRLWRPAIGLGERMNVPVVLSASSQRDLRSAEKLAGRLNPQRTMLLAATEPLAAALRQRLDPAILIETIPFGALPANTDALSQTNTDSFCAIVSGNGVFDVRYQAMLEAIGEIVDEQPEAQFFFDGLETDQHELWNAASRLDLLAHVSLVPRRMNRRDLLLRGDVFCQPQSLNRSRSLTLEAMAQGVPLLVADDPWVDHFIEDQTVRLVHEPTAEAWTRALRNVIADRRAARELGTQSKAWVREHRPVSRMVDATRQAYRRISGETIPFPGDV